MENLYPNVIGKPFLACGLQQPAQVQTDQLQLEEIGRVPDNNPIIDNYMDSLTNAIAYDLHSLFCLAMPIIVNKVFRW